MRARSAPVAIAVAGERGRALAKHLDGVVVGDTLPDAIGGLIDLRALDSDDVKSSLFLAQRAQKAFTENAMYVVVTSLAESNPVTAALHGLLKTAALEWPSVRCAAIDLEPGVDPRELVEEINAGLPDREVILGRTRRVPLVAAAPIGEAKRVIDSRSVVVASGGARGVTATTLLALAEHAKPALLLLGRTALVDEPECCVGVQDEASLKRALLEDSKNKGRPAQLGAIGEEAKRVLAVREIRAFLDELGAKGARVMYRAVDVRNLAAVSGACNDARAAFGPITALVHGAGVLADKKIEDKTREQVDRVMDTKVDGLLALLESTKHDPLDTVALFSSVAGRFGNVGQVDYAMANEAVNEIAVAFAKKKPGVVVKSFNWGPWEGGMVTPALKKMFAERGVRVLSHEDGARHFLDELLAADSHVEVVVGGELGGGQAPARQLVDARTWPMLEDHAIRGVPVLPVVGAMELVARAVQESTGKLPSAFVDVRVLRGVRLPRFFDEGHIVEVSLTGDLATLRLLGDATPAYQMRFELNPTTVVPLSAPTTNAIKLDRIYGDLLFHGPRFAVVDEVEGASIAGMIAKVRGVRAASWPQGFVTDAAALDAALQLALLWARTSTGGAYLPTAIARVDLLGLGHGSMSCVLSSRGPADLRAVVDVDLADGAPVASLRGVQVHRLPDDNAFARDGTSP